MIKVMLATLIQYPTHDDLKNSNVTAIQGLKIEYNQEEVELANEIAIAIWDDYVKKKNKGINIKDADALIENSSEISE